MSDNEIDFDEEKSGRSGPAREAEPPAEQALPEDMEALLPQGEPPAAQTQQVDGVELRDIGLGDQGDERIYKFTELYNPPRERVPARYQNTIDGLFSKKVLRDFEKTCVLPPFDLSGSLQKFAKRVKESSQARAEQRPVAVPERPAAAAEEPAAEEVPRITCANSHEFVEWLARELAAEWRTRRERVVEDPATLLKKIDEARKEKIEEEQQKRQKRNIQQKLLANELNFDALMKGPAALATPTFGHVFDDGRHREETKSSFDRVESYFLSKQRAESQSDTLPDQQLVHDFRRFLRASQPASRARLPLSERYSADLRAPCFFQYRLAGQPDSRLTLDIYHRPPAAPPFLVAQPNYRNPFLSLGFLAEQGEARRLLDEARRWPYIDANDPYFRALMDHFRDEQSREDKKELNIVIEDKKGRSADKDTLKDQQATRIKKIIRLTNAPKGRTTDLAEEDRKDILENKQSEIRKMLDIDNMGDYNQFEEQVMAKKRKAKPIYHSKVAGEFYFHDFVFPDDKMAGLYRGDFTASLLRAILLLKESERTSSVTVVNRGQDSRLLSKLQSHKIVEPHSVLDSVSKLSLKSDPFVLFEYVEKDPLILSDIGMGSRLERLIYTTRMAINIIKAHFAAELKANEEFLSRSKDELPELYKKTCEDVLGPKGQDILLVEQEKLPLIGQLTTTSYCGVSMLDSNLASTPVFTQKTRGNDFLLVVTEEKGERRYFLRRIECVYVAGQIEPKQEVFSPYSRQYTNFQAKLLRFYIKMKFDGEHRLDIENLKAVFSDTNEHNLRRQIKAMGGEEEHEDRHVFVQKKAIAYDQMEISNEADLKVSPEEICLYQRMKQSQVRLKLMGIGELKSTDKISILKTKYYRKNLDQVEKTLIAKRILEEIQLSAWNVSQSFIVCRQGQGRMYLSGFGDPTHGHGGINYIKLPQKISRYESSINRRQQNKSQQTVTGTSADLRSLNMSFVHKILIEFGFKEEALNKLERWDKIELLKNVSASAADKGEGSSVIKDLIKFSRNQRMTTERQKEKYQADIDKLFMKMIDTLSNKNFGSIKPREEIHTEENLDKLRKEQAEELTKYKNINNSDEERQEKPREPRRKAIVLKDCIRKDLAPRDKQS